MKVLLINKFFYQRGGSETYNFSLADAIKAKGHEVIFFSMNDEKNLPCEQQKYFVPNVDYNSNSGLKGKITAATTFFYNKVAAEKMEQLIADEKPDIAHIGLIHRQITFSVVDVLKKHNIPIVMTMHDLIFACPNYIMLSNGAICDDCMEGSVINCIKKRCVKGSTSKSILAACEKKYLQYKRYYDLIDLYITECNYYKKIMEKAGITKSRIICKTNFLPINQEYIYKPRHGEFVLYFGRFSKEKGIVTLLKAHKQLGCKYKLMLVGAGTIQEEIEAYIKDNGITNVELPGAIYGEEMEKIIENAKVIVMPSEWYENCPYALLQSIAKGKIEIASDIGGLPELIEDGKTGFLFEPGNSKQLAEKIEMVMTMENAVYDNLSKKISEEARKNHYWEQYVDMIIFEYKRLLKGRR